jgi:hypothetical protein
MKMAMTFAAHMFIRSSIKYHNNLRYGHCWIESIEMSILKIGIVPFEQKSTTPKKRDWKLEKRKKVSSAKKSKKIEKVTFDPRKVEFNAKTFPQRNSGRFLLTTGRFYETVLTEIYGYILIWSN